MSENYLRRVTTKYLLAKNQCPIVFRQPAEKKTAIHLFLQKKLLLYFLHQFKMIQPISVQKICHLLQSNGL